MMHKLIRSFAYENFGSDYHVAPQGHNKTIQPLALIAKENLSCWRRATRRPKKIVMESLESYLTSEEAMRSKVMQMLESSLQKDTILTVNSGISASTTEQLEMEIGDAVVGHFDRNTILGELNLSSVQEEYYKDMSLRDILSNAKLDPAKMELFEKNKFYIITGVVYSEKLQICGKREEKDAFNAHVKFLPRIQWMERFTNLKAGMSWTDHPAPPIERNERSPLLFTFAKVKYNQESSCLELQQLVGAKLNRKRTLDVVADSVADSLCPPEIEIVVTTREQWIYEDLMESTERHKELKLQVVTSLLEETESLSDLSLRTRKYIQLVERITKTDQMVLQTEAPFSARDLKLLQATGVEVEPHKLNNSKTLRITAHKRSTVLEFAQIFYHLQEMQEEEWNILKEFWGNPNDMKDGKDFKEEVIEGKEAEESNGVKNENATIEEKKKEICKDEKCLDKLEKNGIYKDEEETTAEDEIRKGLMKKNENFKEEKEQVKKDEKVKERES